ncbi:MAG: triple tyrosine motif-containing protein [Pseudomonadota bacterium]
MRSFFAGSNIPPRVFAVALLAAAEFLMCARAWALDPERTLAQFHHTAWTVREGMPSGINVVAQTPDGFLWLGSGIGLYRFDGVRAEPFALEQQPYSRSVLALATANNGDLWVGFTGTRIGRVSRGALTVFDVPTPATRSGVFSVVPDRDGSVWVGLRDSVLNFDGQNWRTFEGPWSRAATWSDAGGVWTLDLAPDGTVWAKNLLALYCLRRGAHAFEQAPGYAGGLIGFARDPQGKLWTSDFTARRFYPLPDLVAGHAVPSPRLSAAVPDNMTGIVRADRDGTLWNANRNTGFLYRATSFESPGILDRFTVKDGLSAEFPMEVFEDREGSIWIPTALGMDRFRHANIVIEPGVPIRDQASAMVATREAVFVYSGMGARVADPDGEKGRRLFRIRPGAAPELIDADAGQVTSLAAAPDGSIVFSREGELLRWHDGVVTTMKLPAELVNGHVINLVETDTALIVSFHERGAYQLSGGRWTRISPASANQEEVIVAVDAARAVWMFHAPSELIVRVEGGRTTEFRSPVGPVRSSLADRDGIVILGPAGLARFDGRKFLSIPISRAPWLANGYGIAQSADGGVWIGTRPGIIRIEKAGLLKAFADPAARLDLQLFDAGDGFTGGVTNDMFNGKMIAGPDGRIWFFMNTGTGWIDPARLYRNPQPPPVVITSIAANGRHYDMPQSLALPAGVSQLEIDYTALSLAIPERVRFRYRLTGVDEDWVDAGSRRQAFYTNVPPGERRFQVIAANNDGVWNEDGTAFSFTIAPTFVQSIWFKLLVVLAAAGLVWAAYRLRLRQETARLQRRFEIRIAERERIARELHDTLLQSVQGLILRFHSILSRVPADSDLLAPMHEAIGRADTVVAEGRDRVRELRTTMKVDLAQSIVNTAREIIQGESPRFAMIVEGTPRVMHALVNDEVLGVAAEAIRNAAQHSKAQTLQAILIYGTHELQMRIRDDGAGIAQTILNGEKGGHYGLIGMRERAKRIGGRLEVTRREHAGTEIALTIPGGAAYRNQPTWFMKRLRSDRTDA